MLFDIDKEGNLFSQDPRITLDPRLNALYKHKEFGSKYVRWVALVYDYDSIHRFKPFAKRLEDVTKQIFGTKTHKPLEDKIVKDGIASYNELQYDALREQYNLLMETIADFNNLLRKTKVDSFDEWDDIKKYQDVVIKMEDVQTVALNLKKRLSEEAQAKKGRLRGGGEKSFLERNLEGIHKELDRNNE